MKLLFRCGLHNVGQLGRIRGHLARIRDFFVPYGLKIHKRHF